MVRSSVYRSYQGITAPRRGAGGIPLTHRRRINTEEKAKVVAVVYRTEYIKFFAVLAVLHQDDFEE